MESRNKVIKVQLANGSMVHVQATLLGGEENVAFAIPAFKEVTTAVEGIAESMVATLQRIKPHKARLEFELEFGLEAGQLTAILVKGSGTSNLKITLEWEQGFTSPVTPVKRS